MFRRRIVVLLAFVALVAVACFGRQRVSPEELVERDTGYLSDFWEAPASDAPAIEPASTTPDPRVRAFYDTVRQAGGKVYLVAKPKGNHRTINVRMRIPESAIEVVGDTQRADIDLGGVEIRVVQLLTATARASDRTTIRRAVLVVPYAPDRDLSSVFLVKTYTQTRVAGSLAPPQLATVSTFDVKDELAGLVSVVQLQVPANNCDTAAISEVGDEVVDMGVTFHPIQGCNDDQCKHVYAAWLRAYHDVGIIQKMLGHIENQPADHQPIFWREPWADQDGNTLKGTSLEYYFGDFAPHRLTTILAAYNRLWGIMKDAGDPSWDWKFACEEETPTKCSASNNVAAFHGPRGHVGLCADRFFSQEAEDSDLFKRQAFQHVRLLVHEALHFTPVPVNGTPTWVDDTHKHRHGTGCASVLRKVDDRKWCQVLHLAVYPGPYPDGYAYCEAQIPTGSDGCNGCSGCSAGIDCSHHDIATHNNDTYGFATAKIGKGLRLEGAHHWPSSQYPSSPDGSCMTETPNPGSSWGDPLDICSYAEGTLQCTGGGNSPSLSASAVNVAIDCGP